MGKTRISKGMGRLSPLVLAGAICAFALPGAGLAVAANQTVAADSADIDFLPFTPAGVDPTLARKVAALVGEDALRFTPATKPRPAGDRTVTFAVRVDENIARSIGGRSAIDQVMNAPKTGDSAPTISSSRYNLGIARGYQSFAAPASKASMGTSNAEIAVRDFSMPDLRELKTERKGKPSRFQSRVALEQQDLAGRAPLTIEGAGEQRLDLRTSYRLSRNLDVTAGVRLSQDRDRLAPLTDGVEDDQAVYVGTQIKF
ncbi:hypothetical protein E3U23_08965 [Erythrobacter litoralis]|uniref:hypothetical protein n=1 Tax=Erythrobacter litoralis TaxID=39960 RepID=UPI002434DBAA|nr:hypothetical protein [Erythrobacter litoralis]MDG6079322.1 hypothetical protein [Erythrobacter litoralis]